MHSRTFSSRSTIFELFGGGISSALHGLACRLPSRVVSSTAETCYSLGLIALAVEVDLLIRFQIASIPEFPTWLIAFSEF